MKITKRFHEYLIYKSNVIKILRQYSIILFLSFFFSCNVTPQAIDYGNDGCHFCKMTIVDKVHAAEIVTNKGKVYKFDATECMINFLKDFDSTKVKLYLTTNYSKPEELIDATKATYLISQNIPSPMGAFISGFKNKSDAEKMQLNKDGELFTWENLLAHLKN